MAENERTEFANLCLWDIFMSSVFLSYFNIA
jgi:hypothetical protein